MAGSLGLQNDLKKAMKKHRVKLSPEMMSKCMGMLTNYKITAEQLADVWEVYSINHEGQDLTPHNWMSFRSAVEKQYAQTPAQSNKKAAVVSRSAMSKRSVATSSNITSPSRDVVEESRLKKIKRDVLGPDPDNQLEQIVSGNVISSPQKNDALEDESTSSSALALVTPPKSLASPLDRSLYATRENAGATVVTYNPFHLDPIVSKDKGRSCVITHPFSNHLSESYKYMSDVGRHVALDRHLQTMTEKMMESYGISSFSQQALDFAAVEKEEQSGDVAEGEPLPPFQFVGVASTVTQTNIGRICNEAHDGKLNATSLLLEGTRHGSNGARIELDVQNLSNYCLFQGQIVGVTGINHSGSKMVVKTLMEGLDCKGDDDDDMAKSPKDVFGKDGLKVYAVAGPYTTSTDLKYQPLADFLALVLEDKPDVVIMMGPFVDMRQEMIQNGEDLVVEYDNGTKVHVCYEQFFAAKIATELESLYEEDPDLKTQFVLVPSMDDAVSEPVYPQPPLKSPLEKVIKVFVETEDMPYGSLCLDRIETAGGKKIFKNSSDRRIHLVANPSTIQINEVTIGFTSLDAYMHISTESVTKLPVGNRLQTLAEQFIKQRSYYPIFPSSSGHGRDFNLDVTKMDAYAMPIQPDILIFPSLLGCTATSIAKGTTFVNPGHLVKGSYGGTFAILDIHPVKSDISENSHEDNIKHSVNERIRVEVRKI